MTSDQLEHYEIYDTITFDTVGEAIKFKDGRYSITINGHFSGIYLSFEGFAAGMNYKLRRMDSNEYNYYSYLY